MTRQTAKRRISGQIAHFKDSDAALSPCEGPVAPLPTLHRSSDAASPSLGVSSLDFGLRFGAAPFFLYSALCEPDQARAEPALPAASVTKLHSALAIAPRFD
jgi:hypothetical protein